jgi:hypothetical protein
LAHPTQEQALAEYQRIGAWLRRAQHREPYRSAADERPGNTQYVRWRRSLG